MRTLFVKRSVLHKRPGPHALFGRGCASHAADRASLPHLHVAILLGSTRVEGPPRPANVGRRVGAFVEEALRRRGHEVDIVDPVEEALPLLVKPHFAYAKGRAPARLDELERRLRTASAYVAVTPEYNHAPSPALLNMMNHFGSSVFSFKPSAIVSYSQGQWGGTRAAHALRPVLSELGCLPVSAMVHVPHAHEVLDADGVPRDREEHWRSYSARCWFQLEWWGAAARNHHMLVDPSAGSPALATTPKQRNAP